jgi:hypothetical protein
MELPIQIPPIIIKQRNKILNIGIILLTFIIANNIYKSQIKSIQSLREKIEAETKKNEMLSNISQSEKILNAYKNLLNKKDISQVKSISISTISNIAKDSNVKIALVKPLAEDNQSVYSRYSFSLVLNAPNYHNVGKFINRLESHPDVYFVDKVIIKRINKESATEYNLIVELTLSTIVFKDK